MFRGSKRWADRRRLTDTAQVAWRWAGRGNQLWHARVEIFVGDDTGRLVNSAARATSDLLDGGGPDARGAGADQGTGLAVPVIGLTFAVSADSPGQAVQTAVDVATEALASNSRGLFAASVLLASSVPEGDPTSRSFLDDGLFSPATGPIRPNQWRWTGIGHERWHTRVEVFVDENSGRLVAPAAQTVSDLLEHGDAEARAGRADQGTGLAEPVIGLTFMVAADYPGQAAQTAVDVATEALGTEGRGIYGVSVFRASKAPANPADDYPTLMD